ncbi:MAG TPA: hypothetical protein VKS21_02530 [Spirochaetota bacterium]|nr:hypothetical protein [Spirochaetota bacterium]
MKKIPPTLMLITLIAGAVILLSLEIYLNTMIHNAQTNIITLEKKIDQKNYEKFTVRSSLKIKSQPGLLLQKAGRIYHRRNKDQIPIIKFTVTPRQEKSLHANR